MTINKILISNNTINWYAKNKNSMKAILLAVEGLYRTLEIVSENSKLQPLDEIIEYHLGLNNDYDGYN